MMSNKRIVFVLFVAALLSACVSFDPVDLSGLDLQAKRINQPLTAPMVVANRTEGHERIATGNRAVPYKSPPN